MDTGKVSFVLNIIVILISFSGFWIVFYLIKNKIIEESQIDKVVELGKWVIGSVALVAVVSIIADGFKEREQDVKELEYFDKYISTAIEADGIQKKWMLVQYLSTVSPPGEMQKSWNRYRDSLKYDYQIFQEKQKLIDSLDNKIENSRGEDSVAMVRQKDSLQNEQLRIDMNYKKVILNDINASDWESYRIDVFYLEDEEKDAKPRAEKTKKILTERYPNFDIRTRSLSKVVNSKPGYRIAQNQIRYESKEGELAKEILSTIQEENVFDLEQPMLHKVKNITPNYISVFVIK